jgi:transposase
VCGHPPGVAGAGAPHIGASLRPDDHEKAHRDWRIPDELWERIVPLIPPRKPHPLGCHRPRVDDRQAMDAIFFMLRTGCQWHALHETGICSSRSAHRRFQAWTEADVFVALWEQGLVEYDARHDLDWAWLAMDGARTKAPLGGKRRERTPRIAARLAPSAAASPTAVGCRLASRSTGQPERLPGPFCGWWTRSRLLIAKAPTQFIGLCSSLKWSRHRTKAPFLALPATAGSNASYKIISAGSTPSADESCARTGRSPRPPAG